MKVLLYTIAIDNSNSGVFAAMARMFYASWNWSGNCGDVCIVTMDNPFSNGAIPSNLKIVSPPDARCWPAYHAKARALEWIPWGSYDVILFVDVDCLFTRRIVFPDGDWDVLVQPGVRNPMNARYYNSWLTDEEMVVCNGRKGINSGTWAIRGCCFKKVCSRWLEVLASPPMRPLWREGSDQAAWNRVILDCEPEMRVCNFPCDTVSFPFLQRNSSQIGAVLHFAGVGPEIAVSEMFRRIFDMYSCPDKSPAKLAIESPL